MYATVRHLTIKEAFKDENRHRVHDELLPLMRKIPGFVDYYLVYEDGENEISIGLFKDKKGADELNRIADQFVKGIAPKVHLKSTTLGEVVVEARAPAIA